MPLRRLKSPYILIIYKLSALSTAGKLSTRLRNTQRFLQNHEVHYATLRVIEEVLNKHNIKYHKHARGTFKNYAPYDIVITIGGDGTVLEAARWVNCKQLILGVNSDPNWSVGQFCCANAVNFEKVLKNLLDGKLKVCRLYKMNVHLNDGKRSHHIECLNDVLICHRNPAAMSRYELMISSKLEDHRSSGIWFSTASGSTGAMLSAGGKKMPLSSTDIQYKPRELYHTKRVKYQFTGGLIKRFKKATVISFMPHGRVFVDGAHVKFPFTYGSRAEIKLSSNFVQLVHG